MAVVEHLSGVTDCFVRLRPGDNHLENFPSSGQDVIVIEETYILSALIQRVHILNSISMSVEK